jgi:hypothetical protein
LSIVSGSASYWARYSSTSSVSVSVLPTFLSPEMFERPFECFRRVTLGGEASPLQPSRTRTVGPVPVRPYRSADRALLELEDLTLLHRQSLPSHLASV